MIKSKKSLHSKRNGLHVFKIIYQRIPLQIEPCACTLINNLTNNITVVNCNIYRLKDFQNNVK